MLSNLIFRIYKESRLKESENTHQVMYCSLKRSQSIKEWNGNFVIGTLELLDDIHEIKNIFCVGYSRILLCYALSTGKQIPEFLRIVPSSYSQSRCNLDCSVLNMKALPFLQAPVAIHQSTQRDITESLILQRHSVRTAHDNIQNIFKNLLINLVAGGNVNTLGTLTYVQHK